MRSYLDLIPISASVKRKQSRMTIMCIVLAVFLVSGVFSMADMGVRAEKAKLIAKHGSWHVMLQDVDDTTARGILSRGDIAAVSWFDSVNYKLDQDYRIGGKLTAVCGTEEAYITDIRTDEYTGRFPRGADEIMLSTNAEELLGIHIGDRITLTTPAGDVEYTVSGLRYDESAVFYDALVALVDKEAFNAFCNLTDSRDSYPEYYIRFTAHTNAREAIAGIKAEYALTDANISENAATMGLEGFSSNSYIIGYYGIAVFLFFLVLTAGVLMISSSMNSNVAQRTQFFGMLRCIGASTRQIIRFVRLEALNWCKIAIPIGIAAAVVMTWGLCAPFEVRHRRRVCGATPVRRQPRRHRLRRCYRACDRNARSAVPRETRLARLARGGGLRRGHGCRRAPRDTQQFRENRDRAWRSSRGSVKEESRAHDAVVRGEHRDVPQLFIHARVRRARDALAPRVYARRLHNKRRRELCGQPGAV